jgi:hypothetical protein
VASIAGDASADAERLLREAIASFAAIRRPLSESAARFDLRDLLVRCEREQEADDVAEPAVETARRLGAVALLERAESLPPGSMCSTRGARSEW